MDKSHCKTYLAMDHRLPFTDINLPPCTTGRLANHLMGLALEQGGHTKEIGFSANGGMYMQMTFPKSESGQQFCEKANILIERWLSTTQTPSPLRRNNPDWKANLSDTLEVYREMQERLQPLLHYLDGVSEKDAIDVLEKAYGLCPELEETVLVLGKMVQAYLAAQEPVEIQPESYGCQK